MASLIAYLNGCVILLHTPVAEDSLGYEAEQGVRESRTQIRKAALTLDISVFFLILGIRKRQLPVMISYLWRSLLNFPLSSDRLGQGSGLCALPYWAK
jgi:hypothetical protein